MMSGQATPTPNPHTTAEAWGRYASGAAGGGLTMVGLAFAHALLGDPPVAMTLTLLLIGSPLLAFGVYCRRKAEQWPE